MYIHIYRAFRPMNGAKRILSPNFVRTRLQAPVVWISRTYVALCSNLIRFPALTIIYIYIHLRFTSESAVAKLSSVDGLRRSCPSVKNTAKYCSTVKATLSLACTPIIYTYALILSGKSNVRLPHRSFDIQVCTSHSS